LAFHGKCTRVESSDRPVTKVANQRANTTLLAENSERFIVCSRPVDLLKVVPE
jgi:hypothetical protein